MVHSTTVPVILPKLSPAGLATYRSRENDLRMSGRVGAGLAMLAFLGPGVLLGAPAAVAAPSSVFGAKSGEAAAPSETAARADLRTDFESDEQGWGPRGDAHVARTTSAAHGGSASLSVTNRLQGWQGPTVDVTKNLAVGETVAISVWAKLADGQTPKSLKVSIQRDRAGSPSY